MVHGQDQAQAFAKAGGRYTKKPVTIEAVLWDGNMTTVEPLLAKATTREVSQDLGDPALLISTLEGEMRAEVGDWIIRGVKGELYPCKPDVFAATYAAAGDGTSALSLFANLEALLKAQPASRALSVALTHLETARLWVREATA